MGSAYILFLFLTPCLHFHSTLARVMAKQGDVEAVRRYFSEAKTKGLKIGPEFYSLIISAHVERQEFDAARAVIAQMKEDGVQVTAGVYNPILQGYAKTKMRDKIEELLREMVANDVKMDSFTYTLAVRFFSAFLSRSLVLIIRALVCRLGLSVRPASSRAQAISSPRIALAAAHSMCIRSTH